MIIFARAPGSTGWVEIKPEEELSHRGQFWEIRKFAVESDGIMPLARRLGRAEQALRAAGFVDHGPSEKWLAPKAPAPVGWWTEELTKIYNASPNMAISPDMVRAAGIALKVARGEIWDDLLEKWRVPAQTEALSALLEVIDEFGISSGVCCCGDDMARHSNPMDCGHSPVDSGAYYSAQTIEAARAALGVVPMAPGGAA